ncbi:MAG: 2-oxoacid:acceptor oxidoreductase subunit alpha [Acidobacteria bacterium]|nr:2-oxoacid:acceptor oxidoreductase subunit alpha [Acidobacteriota bacterium]
MEEFTVGIGGAAGDGLDKTGDTLARTSSRRGLYVYAYNSYQSLIRGGHIWLRLRIASDKIYSHGDGLNALIALNQDSIERHAPEVQKGGAVLYNSSKLNCDGIELQDGVIAAPLPVAEIVKPFGRVLPIVQNTVAMGALIFMLRLDFDMATSVIAETFAHKGKEVIDQNVGILRAGFEFAKSKFVPLKEGWKFTGVRRPFVTGNQAMAFGAVAGGCRLYTAYPMTPASTILHWMAAHADDTGVVVKQCEDELAVANIAVGAGYAGVRSMCATSGGGFALMTEAIGMAGMIEAPVVFVEVQRGGPSTGLPTKQEQGDLNQVFGASQGDYPRVIIAPADITDCYYTTVEALNLADKYQLPVMIMSDLVLGEHPETVEPDAFRPDVPIERGEIVENWPEGNGPFQRYRLTESGVSPRALPGTANTVHVAGTDDHDEEGVLISDVFTNSAIRRKMMEKRMKKVDTLLKELKTPELEGPKDAEATLVGWGSTLGVIREARQLLAARGRKANQLHIKYLVPFQSEVVSQLLISSKKIITIEANYSGQFARHLRAETGITATAKIVKYDGEPFTPAYIADHVEAILDGKELSLDVTMEEAREMAYHYIRLHLADQARPGGIAQNGKKNGEAVWNVELKNRASGEKSGDLMIGVSTGSIYSYQPV